VERRRPTQRGGSDSTKERELRSDTVKQQDAQRSCQRADDGQIRLLCRCTAWLESKAKSRVRPRRWNADCRRSNSTSANSTDLSRTK
jgi:hypothetical protein